ncbi:flavonol synthase/flavanone 3-hydroxylase [Marasmius fiardii PR-910]|nr:flavonol synthase/flavanone 3-hydroxylase [Marasmius fiardii PR-910]
MTDEESIPIIDFANFGDGTSSEAYEIGKRFFEACRDVGFAYLINTGIHQETVDGMFEWSARFFELPLEIKQKAPNSPEKGTHCGYTGVGHEQVTRMADSDRLDEGNAKGKFPDYKESFDLVNEVASCYENVWLPEEDLPGFRRYATKYFATCREFQMGKLLPALAIGLGLDKEYFLSYHRNGENKLRLLHYPEGPTDMFESGEKGRIGAHTDFGTCTLLFQDDVGGLEVESPSRPGVFIPVAPIRGAMVFNTGDFLMRWSNDTLKSTVHRVRAPQRKEGDKGRTPERFSIPYFIGADSQTMVDCIPGCWGPGRPKKYEPINAAEYIKMKLNAMFGC